MLNPVNIFKPETSKRSTDSLLLEELDMDEIIDQVGKAVKQGAKLVALDIVAYRKYAKAIKASFGDEIKLQLVTETSPNNPEDKMKLIREVKPEAVSISLREFMPRPDYEIEAEEFFTWLKENGIWTQYVLYNLDEIRYFADLADQRIIPEGDNFVKFEFKDKTGLEKVLNQINIGLIWSD